jgi:E3 ubiquitin-protein ligase DOA10
MLVSLILLEIFQLSIRISSTHIAIVRCLADDKYMLQTTAIFISRLITNDSIESSIQTFHVSRSIQKCKKIFS